MSLLPTNNPPSFGGQRRPRHSSRSIPLILRRLFRFPQMDFEYALWQMGYLLIAPSRVYRNIYYHKQTKNQWARDDPAFLVLFAVLLSDFLIVGALVATGCWFVTNRFLAQNAMTHATTQQVEWAYAFDVHCNSFFPVFLILYVVQFFFMPLLQRSNWISLLVGNAMYLISSLWYIYGTFLGYNGKKRGVDQA
ncbi:hypothetical protein [Absidia glauca]|uniref:UNC-50 family protein n=1 Tax=Absidia glauca TaxID=4829 RepID=A0A168LUL8_ABSGL|nr:hypothetical protein [Absidia glauca]